MTRALYEHQHSTQSGAHMSFQTELMGKDDSSPLPHPPKPNLGPGSAPWVGPPSEGDCFQPPCSSTLVLQKDTAYLGSRQSPRVASGWMLPLLQLHWGGGTPGHKSLLVSACAEGLHCTTPVHGWVLKPHEPSLLGPNLATGPTTGTSGHPN